MDYVTQKRLFEYRVEKSTLLITAITRASEALIIIGSMYELYNHLMLLSKLDSPLGHLLEYGFQTSLVHCLLLTDP